MHTPFYDSAFFSSILLSIVTVFVGLAAFVIYQKQQNDRKKDAATIVLLEIQNAASHLKSVKEFIVKDKLIKEDIFLMPTAQWEKYKYLFVRDFNTRQLNEITTFYEKCVAYDKVVEYNNSFFVKNEEHIRANLQSALADYTKSYVAELSEASTENDKKVAHEEYEKLIESFYTQFMEEVTRNGSSYFYQPKKTINDSEAIIATISTNISNSPISTRFEDIIGRNLRSTIHDYLLGKEISQI